MSAEAQSAAAGGAKAAAAGRSQTSAASGAKAAAAGRSQTSAASGAKAAAAGRSQTSAASGAKAAAAGRSQTSAASGAKAAAAGRSQTSAASGAKAAAAGLFVTGTDTSVGKTVLSAALLAAIAASGVPVRAHKPIVTGLDEDAAADAGMERTTDAGIGSTAEAAEDPSVETATSGRAAAWPQDHELLGRICGMAPEQISPLRYGPAVSPHLAAALAGERIDPAAVIEAAREAAAGAARAQAVLVVEGVGGLLVPLTDGLSVRGLAVELGLPLLIAARPSLGTINHTLLSVEAARTAGLDVRAVVLTPWPASPSTLELSNRETIASLAAIEVATLAHVCSPATSALARAGEALPWRRWLEARPAG